MTTVRFRVSRGRPARGRVNYALLDATTEADIAAQQQEDDLQAMQDAGQYVRRVRLRLGLTQAEFSQRIDVPLDTIRNWEQGKRSPTGAARVLLRILSKLPEAALDYFIPVQGPQQTEAAIEGLRKASQALDALLDSHGTDIDAVAADFKQARKPQRVG